MKPPVSPFDFENFLQAMSAEERRNALAAMPEVCETLEVFRENFQSNWQVSESGWLVGWLKFIWQKIHDEAQL